jgi:DNA-binding NarL/FixJ family response regulator
MTTPVTIVLADDHPMFRQGLHDAIVRNTPHVIVGEAADGVDAYKMIVQQAPELAILDVEMPGMSGLDVAQRASNERLPVRIIILTMYREHALFNRAVDAGVRGYILKESAVRDIITGVRAVADGEFYFSPALSSYLMRRRVLHPTEGRHADEDAHQLTAMEKEILRLIGDALSSRDIAERLSISVRTVDTHRYNITHKLGLNGSYALLRYALASRGGA